MDPDSPEQNEIEEPSVNVADFTKSAETFVKYKKGRRRKLIITIIVIILLLVGTSTYLFLKDRKPNSNAGGSSSQTASKKQNPPTDSPIISQETKKYNSTQFALDIDYPADWTVESDTSKNQMTITSPELKLPSATGSFQGRIVLKIRATTGKLPEFEKGNASAALDSQKLTYAKPSAAQRGQTYLSFLNYFDSQTQGAIDALLITGDFGYQKEQAVPMVDAAKLDPVITVSFLSCDGDCTNTASLNPDAWDKSGLKDPIIKMLQSVTVH